MLAHHHYRSTTKRAAFSFLLVATVMSIGTLGIHKIERYTLIDSFYFMSMIATAQGPPFAPATTAGKLFASFMAFLSVGTVVAALGFLLGPFFGKLWKIGVEKLEEEIHLINKHKDQP